MYMLYNIDTIIIVFTFISQNVCNIYYLASKFRLQYQIKCPSNYPYARKRILTSRHMIPLFAYVKCFLGVAASDERPDGDRDNCSNPLLTDIESCHDRTFKWHTQRRPSVWVSEMSEFLKNEHKA